MTATKVSQDLVSTSIVDYGTNDEIVNNPLRGYIKDDIEDMSRLGKIQDNIKFYSKEVYSDVKKG